MTVGSSSLQVGDHATGNTHNVSRCCTEVVVPRSRRGPHLVVLQQVRVHEHTQLSAVTEGGHAASGFGNQCPRATRLRWRVPLSSISPTL